ncbi:MAG: T9SS type A sorting domain-containing protein [Bacteroidales bacterium]|nr:T9SS type A sorting domain-containing protein [Bacteroidales bacterium]
MTDPTYFYYSGRILDPQFAAETTVGTASVANNVLPFTFTKEHSVGVIMYTADDLGFSDGIIDTISLYVHTVGSGNVPMKLYLKNDNTFVANDYPNLTPALVNQLYQNNWNNLTNGATVIADGNFEFNQTGWYKFVIPGGFHYTGNSLLLLTEHHGKNTSLGYSAPVFRSTNVPSVPNSTYNKRVVYYSTDNNFTPTLGTMTQGTVRFNTKFNISYACESAGRGVITVHTSVPNVDLDVVSINNPTTPNLAYTNNETVTVQLANHGSNAANNYSLSYQLEGQAPVTVNNPVNVPSNGTVTYSFTTPVNLSEVYFPRSFKVYVTCAADNHHNNDTITIMLRKEVCESGAQTAISPSIANVTFAGIDNVALPAGWSPFGTADTAAYTDYTQTVAPAVLVKGQTYPISITNAFTGTSGVKLYKYVFIDFNRNGSFELTGTNIERVVNITNANAFNNQHPENATSEAYITVPATATEGTTLMRVVASTATTVANTGCGYYAQGETEDYMVTIRGAFNNDLAVVGYLQPSGVSCPDPNGNVKVYVKNQGVNAQTFTASNPLQLTAQVTGVTPGTYTATISYGSIAAGETNVYTIPGVNISAVGSYTVITSLDYQADEYTVNNAWKTSFTVGNLQVDTVPRLETFDETVVDPEDPFTDFWTVQTSSSSYKWTIETGPSVNNPNAGPEQDHTMTNTMDQYAMAPGKSNQTSTTLYTTLTTNCLNLHYQNGYPIQMDYWEHMFGQTNATGTLLVQVGTGDNFVTIDSVVGPTQTATNSSWKHRVLMFSDNDEVAKVRFRTKSHTRLMDIAIDDVNFGFGKPDLGIAEIVYPYDFRDPEGSCMVFGDTIYPVVRIVNSGLTPVASFDITGKLKVGYDEISFTETWTAEVVDGIPHYFMQEDTLEYVFTNGFVVFTTSSFLDFEAIVTIPQDQNPYNDNYTIHPCASTDIDDYVMESGIVLNQNVPNPADDKTRISFLVPQAGQAVIDIYTLTGQKMYSESINAHFGENYIDLNTSEFAAGMYIYTLQFEGAVLSKKMVIQK